MLNFRKIKILLHFLIVLEIILVFSGCDNVDVIELDLKHEEKIVISANLVGNEFFKGVSITRTIAIDEEYNIDSAMVDNAEAYLIVNELQVLPLYHVGKGIYKYIISEYKIEYNKNYELYIELDNKVIYSKTTVPDSVEILSESFNPNYYLEAEYTAKPKEVYGAIWIISPDIFTKPYGQSDDFYQIVNPNISNPTNVRIRTDVLPEKYYSNPTADYYFIQVYAFDKAYQEYFNSRNDNSPISNSFTISGNKIAWNVYGENVIGLFIGSSKSGWVKVKR